MKNLMRISIVATVIALLLGLASCKGTDEPRIQDIDLASTAWSGKVSSKTASGVSIEIPFGIVFVDKTMAKMEYYTDPTSFIREVGYSSFVWDSINRTKVMRYVKKDKNIRFEGNNIHFMEETWIIHEMNAQRLTLVSRTENMQRAIWIHLTRQI